MKKKLLITASTFPRWEDDTEPRFILDYAKAMQKYYDVTVIVPSAPGTKKKELLEGVEVIRYRYFPIKSMETLCYPGSIVARIKEKKIRALLIPFLLISLYLKLLLVHNQFDVVHAHWLIPQGILQSLFKTPYLVTGHGTDVSSMNAGLIRTFKKHCLENASSVVVVSNALAQIVSELCPEVKTNVVSMGCNTRQFGPQFRKENFFQQGDQKIILFVGRLVEIKGVSYLIEAMKYINAKLIIVGDGPLKRDLQEQAKCMPDKVSFAGAKNHEDLPQIYASADIFVAPSITTPDGAKEGFGLVILEAMASGLPVVANRSGGIVEIVKDGINGLLCDEKNIWQLVDNISTLLDDPDLYASCSSNALKTAAKFDYEEIASRYRELIERVLI